MSIERLLPASPERIWAFLTEKDKTEQWLATMEGKREQGEAISFCWDHDSLTSGNKPEVKEAQVTGQITHYEPHTKFAYTWCMGNMESEVEFVLTEQGENTLLQLKHHNLTNRDLQIDISAGWHTHLGILLDKLNNKNPEPFWKTHKILKEYYMQ